MLELPDTAVELVEYNGFEFDRYWFDYACNGLIISTRNKFKYINVAYDGNNSGIFHLRDINGRWHTWRWKSFYREMMNRVDEINDEDIDYNQPCEFIEPAEDKNVKENCPYKAFRPKNLRTKEEDEWWKAKFRRDKERRECLKAKDVNGEVSDENVDDEISVDECEAEN